MKVRPFLLLVCLVTAIKISNPGLVQTGLDYEDDDDDDKAGNVDSKTDMEKFISIKANISRSNSSEAWS